MEIIISQDERAASRAAALGEDHAVGLTVDLSQFDFETLRQEFADKIQRKHAALQDIRDVVEKKLAQMLARNPTPSDEANNVHSFQSSTIELSASGVLPTPWMPTRATERQIDNSSTAPGHHTGCLFFTRDHFPNRSFP